MNFREIIKNVIPWSEMDKKFYKKCIKAQNYYKNGHRQLAYFCAYRIAKRYACYISPMAEIGKNVHFPHPTGIVIGEGVKIGDNCTIYQNVTIGRKNKDIAEYPIIGSNVIVYSNSTIIGNITIGNNSVIGCNSVVLKSVNNNSKCVGVVK